MSLQGTACRLAGLALLLVATARASTWTVDDDGPADFPSIAAAIPAVAPGDVLLVMPGTYGAFTLYKPLTILGPGAGPRPLVLGRSTVTASSVTLAGLTLQGLTLSGVTGFASVDDCVIGHASLSDFFGRFEADNCSQLLVTRSQIDGHDRLAEGGSTGAVLQHCTAVLVDCTIEGGDAQPVQFPDCANSSHDAVFVTKGLVQFAACALVGGKGGITECVFGGDDSPSGNGLSVDQGDHDVRGTSLSAGPWFFGWQGPYGWALDLQAGLLVLSDIAYGVGSTFNAGGLTTATVPEPVLRVLPDTPQVPGGSGRVEWTAPAGAPGLLLVSLDGAVSTIKKLDGKLWPHMPALVTLPIVGGSGPSYLGYALPDDGSLVGTVVTLQACFPTVPGTEHPNKMACTNPAQIVVRF